MSLKYGPYSNSRLGVCPEQFLKKYILKEEEVRSSVVGTNEGLVVHEMLDLYLKGKIESHSDYLDLAPQHASLEGVLGDTLSLFRNRFTINHDDFIGSEQSFAVGGDLSKVPFTSEDAWYRGIVDYIEIDDNDHARIVDFKNYPIIHTPAQLTDIYSGIPKQMMGYGLLSSSTYSMIRTFELEVYYTRYGTSRHVSFRDDDGEYKKRVFDVDEARRWWHDSCIRSIRAWEETDKFIPIPTQQGCQYCGYVHSCTAVKKPGGPLMSHDEAKEAYGSLLVLDERRKRLRARVAQYVEVNGDITMDSGRVYGPESYVDVSYDVASLVDALPKEQLSRLVKVDKRQMKSFVKKADEETAAKIIEAEIHETKTRLKSKKP